MLDSEIHAAVVAWFNTNTGLVTIQDHQSGDRPALPYVMVNFLGHAEVRQHMQEWEAEEDEESGRVRAFPIIETEWRYSVHVFGENPTDILRPVRSAYHMTQTNEPLMPGLIIHELSQVRNVPEFVNEAWEPRANVDFIVRGLTRDGVLIDTIETHEGFVFTRMP